MNKLIRNYGGSGDEHKEKCKSKITCNKYLPIVEELLINWYQGQKVDKESGILAGYLFFLIFFKDNLFIYLAVLGFCCCKGFSLAVASGGYSAGVVGGLLRIGGFLNCGAWALGCLALVASWHAGSSWTRERTCVLWIDRRILYY